MLEEKVIIEPIPVPNIAIQKIAISEDDYPDLEVANGDVIGIATYMTIWDDDPLTWMQYLSKFPIYSLVKHRWEVLESGTDIPEVVQYSLPVV